MTRARVLDDLQPGYLVYTNASLGEVPMILNTLGFLPQDTVPGINGYSGDQGYVRMHPLGDCEPKSVIERGLDTRIDIFVAGPSPFGYNLVGGLIELGRAVALPPPYGIADRLLFIDGDKRNPTHEFIPMNRMDQTEIRHLDQGDKVVDFEGVRYIIRNPYPGIHVLERVRPKHNPLDHLPMPPF